MNFIQEVLSLLDRKQDKKNLDINRDYFEFGRTKPSSVGNPLYSPKMTPHAIKYKDFKCETIKGLISGTGTEHTLPVWSELDPDNCNVQTVIDSVYSQDAAALTGTVAANLTVNGDLLVLGKQTIIESTIVEIADNIIELNTQGADVDAGFAVGTVNGLKTFGWDATNLLWNTFKENLMTQDIIINKNLKMDGESINLITNSVEGLASEPFDSAIPTTLAVIQYVDENIGGSDYRVVPFDSGSDPFGLIGLTKDGVQDSVFKVLGDDWIKPSSNGGDFNINHATPVIPVTGGDVELSNGDSFFVRNHKYDAAGHIINEEEVSYKLALTGLGSPVMTSTVTGTGKLWDDAIQTVPAVAVSAIDDRTYGVQFNREQQLVVNVPWVEGSGGNAGTVTAVDFTSDIAAFTAAVVDGTTTPSISLDLNGGTAGQFLRQDGLWATIPGGNVGTVTSFAASLVNGDSLSVAVADSTSTPSANFTWGGTASQYVNGEGDLQTFPTIPAASEDVKFKIDAADSAEGYWADKVTIGSGLSQSIDTDANGVKTTTISAVSTNVVNSIKVGSATESGMFEFTGAGVTMDNNVNPTVINFAQSASGIESLSTTWPSGADVAMTLTEVNLNGPDTQLNWDVQGTAAQYIDGSFKLQTFPTIPAVPFTSLTTTGTSGAATLTSGVLNIPEYSSGGTTNCTFGTSITGSDKALTGSFVPIQSVQNTVLGYQNASGSRRSYKNTVSITFNTRAAGAAKSYDFEIRFEARIASGVVVLYTYEDSFYSESDKKITKTYTYYSPNLEDAGIIYVSARSLGLGDLGIATSHLAVISSSCEGGNEGTIKPYVIEKP